LSAGLLPGFPGPRRGRRTWRCFIAQSGLSSEAAEAQAFLLYCFVFGQSLLFLDRGQRRRAQLIAKSAEKLIIAD
jgi:hypothetical protein